MRLTKTFKSLFLVGLLIVSLAILTGCDDKTQLHESDLSQEGVALENYLPKDALFAITLNLNDEDQAEKLAKLGDKFPEETRKKIFEGILEELNKELERIDATLDEDLLPILGENPRVLLGMGSNFPDLEENPDEMPEMYVALTVDDPQAMIELNDKYLPIDPELSKGSEFGEVTYDFEKSAEDSMYVAHYKDTIFMSNKKNIRHEALKRIKNNEESLLNHKLYKELYEKVMKPNFATFYINYEHYFDLIAQLEGEDYPMKFKEGFHMAIFMGLQADDDGVRMISMPAFENAPFDMADFPMHEPYLHNGTPGKNLIMYAEIYNLKKSLEIGMDFYEWDEDTSKELRKAELLVKKTIGIDWKEDILSWMDKGFAMVLQRNDSMIPAISFYVDASSNPEGAGEVIDLLDAALEEAYNGLLASAEPGIDVATIVRKEVVQVGKSELNKFSFDVSGMSDEELLAAGMPSGIFTEPIELYYGLTVNDYFIFSTYSGLDKDFDNFVSVGSLIEVQEGREYVKDYPYNLSYISVEEAFKYVDQIFTAMEKVEGPMDEEALEAYGLVRDFLAPVKYMIGSDKLDQSAGFIKIE
ncbi:DUF3352 domain-containing protein [Patescibacteria group bacterium]